MASDNVEFNIANVKFRKKLSAQISRKLNKYSDKIAKKIGDKFVEVCRNDLLENNNSIFAIEETGIPQSIHLRKLKKGYQVNIPMDEEGLVMFLEYGTGIVGKQDPHEEAGSIGWEYNVRYKNGEREHLYWFYDGSKTSYIDKDDIPMNKRRNGFITMGIQPVRYIYNTKQKFRAVLRGKKTAKQIGAELKSIK